ncbi:MAG: UvrD-helicase domain-containing protein, partial [Gammaproteobacteria bacterium]|nr:UvrD-helicase domain-containing protein [Gammaproteobacteria bacterium]
EDIERECGPVLAESIQRMRNQQVKPQAGFDGQYGVIRIFNEGEIDSLFGQMSIFGGDGIVKMKKRNAKRRRIATAEEPKTAHVNTKKISTTLNSEQQRICQTDHGITVVKAGPGTGKTHTLVEWLAARLANGGKAEQVMAVTFTNKAAEELRDRLTTRVGDKVRRMTIGTFHAIAYRLLQERYPELDKVYDEQSRRVVCQVLFGSLNEQEQKDLVEALGRYFELGDTEGFQNIKEYVSKYRAALQQRNAVDLADIINQLVLTWREQPQWLARHQKQYRIIAVDEFQDINPIQYQFISLLSKADNLLAIGDPDQAIYGFRGADVKLFFQYQQDFQAQEIALTENYRSTGTVLEAAHKLIQCNTVKNAQRLVAHKPQGPQIQFHAVANPVKEASYIVQAIEDYIGGTSHLALESVKDRHRAEYTFADIAVLFRTRAVGRALLKCFKESNIPAQFGEAASLFSAPPFCVIADILRLYVQPRDIVSLDAFLLHGLGWGRRQRMGLLDIVKEDQAAWLDAVPEQLAGKEKDAFKCWQGFYQALPELFKQSGVAGAVDAIFQNYLPEDKLDNGQLLTKESILQLAVEAQADVERFLMQLTLDSYTDIGRIKSDKVRLLTFHAAKGLEFPVVFIAGAEEGITPILKDGSKLEEERRLFYVAMTRAKDALHITCSKERSSYGDTQIAQPSRFIRELPEELIAKADVRQRPQAPKTEQLSFF